MGTGDVLSTGSGKLERGGCGGGGAVDDADIGATPDCICGGDVPLGDGCDGDGVPIDDGMLYSDDDVVVRRDDEV